MVQLHNQGLLISNQLHIFINTLHSYSPVADPLVVDTCKVISVDDALLRTSTGCTCPASSLTLYVD